MDSVITIALPLSIRNTIEAESEARGTSMGEIARGLLAEGMKAKGLTA
jgi:hypothetical protein